MKIIERLLILKGSRKVSAWERSAGIARGNLDRALKDGSLSDENLIKLRRADNINTNWLLCGDGSPYQLSLFQTDLALSEQLSAHYTDEMAAWSVTLFRRADDLLPCAIVLTMPARFQIVHKDKPSVWVDYTVVEVLIGPIGPYTWSVLRRDGWGKLYKVDASQACLNALCAGNVGTFALLHDPGYLLSAENLILTDDLVIAEEVADYQMPLTAKEKQLLSVFGKMTTSDQNRLIAIASVLKEFNGI